MPPMGCPVGMKAIRLFASCVTVKSQVGRGRLFSDRPLGGGGRYNGFMSHLLELKNITHRYGPHVALKEVSLSLPTGAIGLLGPNGAGKSTLLKIIMGLIQPSQGSGVVLGLPLAGNHLTLRQKMGYMSEADALIQGLEGVEYVTLAGELIGMSRRDAQRRAHELLTFLGMEDARYRKLEEYSTGMKQRIKLAQALVHDPPLLLLDEPTSGLDPAGRESMLSLLETFCQQYRKSVILSTHVLGDVERVCSTVVIIDRGQVLRQGRTADLKTIRQDHYRLQLEPVHKVPVYIEELKSEGVDVLDVDRQQTLSVRVPSGWSSRSFFALADNLGMAIRGLERDDEDLDQLFQRLLRSPAAGAARPALAANGVAAP